MRLDIIDQNNEDLEKELADAKKINAKQSGLLKEAMRKHDGYIAQITELRHEIDCLKNDKQIADEGIKRLEATNEKLLAEVTRLENNINFMHRHYVPRSSVRRAVKEKFGWLRLGSAQKTVKGA